MSQFRSDFVRVLHERGFVHQVTDVEALDAAAASGVLTGYIGFDATAPSLHVGSLGADHDAALAAEDGPPAHRADGRRHHPRRRPHRARRLRNMLAEDVIEANIASIARVFGRLLDFSDAPTGRRMADNIAWLAPINYLEFLRTYGPHFTINRMLSFDSVRLRLEREQPLSFLEFNYMLMQAVDFLELHRREGCALQMGGSTSGGTSSTALSSCAALRRARCSALRRP
jgi:tyrosyl-tRNA synthetase